jgi:hypothetical protein
MLRQAVVVCVLITLLTTMTSHASPSYQEGTPLQGKTILFGINNGEADPFDRGDPGASRLAGLLGRAGANVQILNWALSIPPEADLVVLIDPVQDYSGAQIARLWAYLEQGGNLLLLSDPPGADGDALPLESGLFELLWSDYGLRMLDTVLVNPVEDTPPPAPLETVDAEGTPLPTGTPVVDSTAVELIGSLTSNNPQHPSLFAVNLESLVFNFARPIDQESFVETASITTLLLTSARVYGENNVGDLARFGVYTFDPQEDTIQRNYLVAAASEDATTGTRIVLMGDGDLGRNRYGFATSPPGSEAFVFPNTARFLLNTIFWLLEADVSDLEFNPDVAIPTATPTMVPSPTANP